MTWIQLQANESNIRKMTKRLVRLEKMHHTRSRQKAMRVGRGLDDFKSAREQRMAEKTRKEKRGSRIFMVD